MQTPTRKTPTTSSRAEAVRCLSVDAAVRADAIGDGVLGLHELVGEHERVVQHDDLNGTSFTHGPGRRGAAVSPTSLAELRCARKPGGAPREIPDLSQKRL